VDSGAGQSMCSCPDAFLSLRSCAVEVVGVSGSLPVFGIGTVVFVIQTSDDLPVVGLIHDCLLIQGSSFNLLSVSQFQSSGLNSADFAVGSPRLCVTRAATSASFPLVLHDGLYNFSAEPILPNDDRYWTLPRFDLTSPAAFLSSPMPGVSPTLVSVPPWPSLPSDTVAPMLSSIGHLVVEIIGEDHFTPSYLGFSCLRHYCFRFRVTHFL
jgi:hypothetical protein